MDDLRSALDVLPWRVFIISSKKKLYIESKTVIDHLCQLPHSEQSQILKSIRYLSSDEILMYLESMIKSYYNDKGESSDDGMH
ncbi:hypothetical protein SAMN05216243_2322 [Sediminibacillus albus]|uniref:Uncharacterized protein n=1 Tax=Sediminibacillus albus TaxID=407036 RepID=A0A1G9A033_9BACI|nr:hypothetical protein SAMN05216243_2322 [Sediminibacillus albus]